MSSFTDYLTDRGVRGAARRGRSGARGDQPAPTASSASPTRRSARMRHWCCPTPAILRKMFGDAALFGQNTPEGLAGAIREALAHQPELRARSEALKLRRQESWLADAKRASQIAREGRAGPDPRRRQAPGRSMSAAAPASSGKPLGSRPPPGRKRGVGRAATGVHARHVPRAEHAGACSSERGCRRGCLVVVGDRQRDLSVPSSWAI